MKSEDYETWRFPKPYKKQSISVITEVANMHYGTGVPVRFVKRSGFRSKLMWILSGDITTYVMIGGNFLR